MPVRKSLLLKDVSTLETYSEVTVVRLLSKRAFLLNPLFLKMHPHRDRVAIARQRLG